jgi:hypothetical protein
MNSLEQLRVKTLEERRNERRNNVVAMYSKIYGVAKVVFEILKGYGVEVSETNWKGESGNDL